MKFSALLLVLLCIPAWAQNAITVHVTDANKAPLANATVALRIWGEEKWRDEDLKTGADGTLQFELAKPLDPKKPVGSVTVHAPGFALDGRNIKTETMEFALQPGASWRGQVVDEKGAPLAGVTVRATAMWPAKSKGGMSDALIVNGDVMKAIYTAKSDANGEFAIADVPAGGTLSYGAAAPRFARASDYNLSVANQTKIALVPGATFHGHVLGLDGKPLVGARVFAQGTGLDEGYGEAKTAADGTYTIESLAIGTYNVMVEVAEGADYLVPAAADVALAAPETLELKALQAAPGIVIKGVARDAATGKPVADVQIGVYGPHSPASGAAMTSSNKTGADGRFTLRVLAGKNKFYPYSLPRSYLRDAAEQALDVNEKTPELVFDLQSAPTLTGTIVDEKNQPIQAQLRTWGDSLIQSDAEGKWSWTATSRQPLQFGGGEDDEGYFEVLSKRSLEVPQTEPIVVKVRKLPWRTLSGRVVAPDGTARANVEVKANFFFSLSDDGGLGETRRTATTGADGFYRLDKIRADKDGEMARSLKVTTKTANLSFVGGGEIAPDGANWKASDIVLTALDRQITGTTAPLARVVAAGRDAVADEQGKFQFKDLPSGEVTVYAALDGRFGSAISVDEAPVNIELAPMSAQGTDVELGRDAWREVINETQNGEEFYARDWVLAQLNAAQGETFAALQQSAGEPPTPNHDWSLAAQLAKWAPKLAPENRVAQIESVASGIQNPEIRTMAWLDAALAVGDDKLVNARALREAEIAIEKTPVEPDWREGNLYRMAVVAERVEGEKAGAAALDKAIAVTLKTRGAKSVQTDGYMQQGRDGYLAMYAEIVAQGSPALLRRLLNNISPEAGNDVAALGKAIPVVASEHGVEAALPLLEKLRAMPKPDFAPGDSHVSQNEPQYAFDVAARRVVPLLAAKDAAGALELARRISDNDGRARALASVARFESPAVAASLWREAVTLGDISDAPRFAAQAFDKDAKLGRELFELARVRGANANVYSRGGFWAPYAFYLARADAAMARLELEREWRATLASNEGQSLAPVAMAMSAADGSRALEMARQIPRGKDNFWSLEARRKIGQYLVADENQRRDWPFDRWGATDTWSPGEQEW